MPLFHVTFSDAHAMIVRVSHENTAGTFALNKRMLELADLIHNPAHMPRVVGIEMINARGPVVLLARGSLRDISAEGIR